MSDLFLPEKFLLPALQLTGLRPGLRASEGIASVLDVADTGHRGQGLGRRLCPGYPGDAQRPVPCPCASGTSFIPGTSAASGAAAPSGLRGYRVSLGPSEPFFLIWTAVSAWSQTREMSPGCKYREAKLAVAFSLAGIQLMKVFALVHQRKNDRAECHEIRPCLCVSVSLIDRPLHREKEDVPHLVEKSGHVCGLERSMI